MDTHTMSALQSQFPLSLRKKFQKKFLGYVISAVVYGLLAAIIGFFVQLAQVADGTAALIASLAWFVVVAILVLVLAAWYLRVYIRTYYYSADENFLTIKKGAIAPTEIHVQYQKIQDVYVDQDLLDRMFRLYDVHIASATASSGIEAHIDGVEKEAAEGLKNFLLHSIKNGGVMSGTNAAASTPSDTSMPMAPAPSTVRFAGTQEVSSEVYPLTSSWFTMSLISRIAYSVVVGLFVAFAILVPMIGKANGDGGDMTFAIIFGVYYIGTIVWSVVSLFLWKKHYAFGFKEDFIYYKEGAISINEKHMLYSSIQDVNVSQNFLERLFGLARVVILDATQNGPMQAFGGMRRNAWNSNNGLSSPSGIVVQSLTVAQANTISDMVKNTIASRNHQSTNGL